jgi:tetratricopeptide (TPR) repeat protein
MRIVCAPLTIFMLLILPSVLFADDDVKAIEAKQRGDEKFAKKNYDKAIEDYTEAIRLNPKYWSPYYGRGVAYYWKKNYDKAIKDYTEAIRLNPKNASAYIALGDSYSQRGNYDKALSDYAEAVRLNPKDTVAQNRMTALAKKVSDIKANNANARALIEKQIIDIEAMIPGAEKRDAENARYNNQKRQEYRKAIDEAQDKVVVYLKNKEFGKAASLQTLILVNEGLLQRGEGSRDEDEADRLRQTLAVLKKQLVDLPK